MDESSMWWLLWFVIAAGGFAILEYKGLISGSDESYTLTNRIRLLMRYHPIIRVILMSGIAIGLIWLFNHFLLVDPEVNPGAFITGG